MIIDVSRSEDYHCPIRIKLDKSGNFPYCVGSKCMAWIWMPDGNHGFCVLVRRQSVPALNYADCDQYAAYTP